MAHIMQIFEIAVMRDIFLVARITRPGQATHSVFTCFLKSCVINLLNNNNL
jgi:hypothetical protein